MPFRGDDRLGWCWTNRYCDVADSGLFERLDDVIIHVTKRVSEQAEGALMMSQFSVCKGEII